MGRRTPLHVLGPLVCGGREGGRLSCSWGGTAAALEVLLLKCLDAVSISVLFEDRLGKIAQFITSLKGNSLTSVFLK